MTRIVYKIKVMVFVFMTGFLWSSVGVAETIISRTLDYLQDKTEDIIYDTRNWVGNVLPGVSSERSPFDHGVYRDPHYHRKYRNDYRGDHGRYNRDSSDAGDSGSYEEPPFLGTPDWPSSVERSEFSEEAISCKVYGWDNHLIYSDCSRCRNENQTTCLNVCTAQTFVCTSRGDDGAGHYYFKRGEGLSNAEARQQALRNCRLQRLRHCTVVSCFTSNKDQVLSQEVCR